MSDRVDRAQVRLTASMEELAMDRAARPDPDTPFRILCLGDFSGRSSGDLLLVDRDDLDDALARSRPEVRLETPVEVTLDVTALDDLHPDRLFERLGAFEAFRGLRKRLHDPEGFRAAAEEVRRWTGTRTAPDPSPPAEARLSEDQEIVRELLAGGARRAPEDAAWAAFVRRLVAPHVVAREDPQRPELVAAVDRASAALMRDILHHPRVQAVEATWRGVDFLARRLETGTELQVYLLDIGRDDLAAALGGRDEARARLLRRVLVDRATTPGAVPWAVLIGDYTFDATAENVEALAAMAGLAREAGAPFVAAASARLLGVDSLDLTPDPDDWRALEPAQREPWQRLRASAVTSWLGLALPRFLLRLPYGRDGEPLEAFKFEELLPDAPHEEYLWGNPAFACACLLGRAFSEDGWSLAPGAGDLDDLPLYVEEKKGERRVKPCAEVLLTERAAEIVLERGLMPLLSFRDRDRIRLARFQSVREPLTALAGRWRA